MSEMFLNKHRSNCVLLSSLPRGFEIRRRMKHTLLLLITPAALLACKPAADPSIVKERWKILNTASGLNSVAKGGTHADNPVLLDTATGQTWLLWPTADRPAGYSWIELSRRTDKSGSPSSSTPHPLPSASPSVSLFHSDPTSSASPPSGL